MPAPGPTPRCPCGNALHLDGFSPYCRSCAESALARRYTTPAFDPEALANLTAFAESQSKSRCPVCHSPFACGCP